MQFSDLRASVWPLTMRILLGGIYAAAFSATQVSAEDAPTLNVGGKVLSVPALTALPVQTIDLNTVWDIGGAWEGVLLTDVLDTYGMSTFEEVTVRAVDLYEVTLDRQQLDADEPLLAYSVNGNLLTAETMGPLMLIWPKQAQGALDGTEELTNWVWSVTEISAADDNAVPTP